jgi:hypothetical protein
MRRTSSNALASSIKLLVSRFDHAGDLLSRMLACAQTACGPQDKLGIVTRRKRNERTRGAPASERGAEVATCS